MHRRKKVTLKTIAANQQNAQKSTGPRTEAGNANSRFNAVNHGLYASHVPIPLCDGHGCEEQFSNSLMSLALELKPRTRLELHCVEAITEGMWKLGRVARAEAASIRSAIASCETNPLLPAILRIQKSLSEKNDTITILSKAKEELQRRGKLTRKTRKELIPLLGGRPETDSNFKPDSDFLQRLDARLSELQMEVHVLSAEAPQMLAAHVTKAVLPVAEDMDRIIRYDNYTQRKIASALRMLWELQQRRKQCETEEPDTRRSILSDNRKS